MGLLKTTLKIKIFIFVINGLANSDEWKILDYLTIKM
jgi:hypothetical protein